MPLELKMPALSPTMEEGTLAKWLVKEGDDVKSGDILAEIETDKATMEFEAVDEGKIAKILVAEGTDGVKVGAPIAILAGEGEEVSAAPAPAPAKDQKKAEAPKKEPEAEKAVAKAPVETPPAPAAPAAPPKAASSGDRVKASPLARRLAEAQGIDLSTLTGSGPGGRVALSGKHVLALSNRGDGTASDLLTLAREVRDGVRARFGVELVPEPVLVNCGL